MQGRGAAGAYGGPRAAAPLPAQPLSAPPPGAERGRAWQGAGRGVQPCPAPQTHDAVGHRVAPSMPRALGCRSGAGSLRCGARLCQPGADDCPAHPSAIPRVRVMVCTRPTSPKRQSPGGNHHRDPNPRPGLTSPIPSPQSQRSLAGAAWAPGQVSGQRRVMDGSPGDPRRSWPTSAVSPVARSGSEPPPREQPGLYAPAQRSPSPPLRTWQPSLCVAVGSVPPSPS